MAFFAVIDLPIFILGVILVLLAKKSKKHKSITIIGFLGAVILFWPIWKYANTTTPETFLIPGNYRGKVVIIYDKKCGLKAPKENNRLVYNIPKDGVLIISNKHEHGFIDQEYYLVDNTGNRKLLAKMDISDFNEEWTLEKSPNEPSRNKLGVFGWGTTGTTSGSTPEENYTSQEFHVSTYSDLNNRFGFLYEQKFDSIVSEKLKRCK